jgi:hypothetical protein
MCYRRLFQLSGVAALGLASLLLSDSRWGVVQGQSEARPAAKSVERSVAKTPWGDPDLQGVWGLEYETPLQRSDKYAGREFHTEEERAAIDKERSTGSYFNAASRAITYDDIYLSRKRAGPRTSLIVDPPDGKIPSFTAEAQQRRDGLRQFQLALLQPTDACKNGEPACAGGKYGPPSPLVNAVPPYYLTNSINRSLNPEDRSLRERCMQGRLPDLGLIPYPYFLEFVQSPGTIAIYYDTGQGEGWQRIIPINSGPHLPPHVRQWGGDSRGRWEGNALVVEVTNFSPKTEFQGSRETLRLIERWNRIDARTLEYTVTMDDPKTWTRPWTVKQEYGRQPDGKFLIFKDIRCHEGNYGMPSLLRGAREEEKAFAEGRGPDPATKRR